MGTVLTVYRAYKAYRIAQLVGFSQLAIRPIGMYLLRSQAAAFAIGQAFSAFALYFIDQAADPANSQIHLQTQNPITGRPGAEFSFENPSRRLGLRTLDEATDAVNAAVTDIRKFKGVEDFAGLPSILRTLGQDGGITPYLGVTAPDMLVGVLKEQIPGSERQTKNTPNLERRGLADVTQQIDKFGIYAGSLETRFGTKPPLSGKGWIIGIVKVAAEIL